MQRGRERERERERDIEEKRESKARNNAAALCCPTDRPGARPMERPTQHSTCSSITISIVARRLRPPRESRRICFAFASPPLHWISLLVYGPRSERATIGNGKEEEERAPRWIPQRHNSCLTNGTEERNPGIRCVFIASNRQCWTRFHNFGQRQGRDPERLFHKHRLRRGRCTLLDDITN